MSRAMSAREIAVQALRKVGAIGAYDVAAPDELVRIALDNLDMVFQSLAARRRRPWLIPGSVTFSLPQSSPFNVVEEMGNDAPEYGIQYPIGARLLQPNASSSIELPIVRRTEWDAIPDKDKTGCPQVLYLTSDESPDAFVWPVPERAGYSVELTFQTFSDPAQLNPGERTKRRQALDLYLVTELSYWIGNGPVVQCDAGKVQEMRIMADRLLLDFDSYAGREHPRPSGRVAYTDF